MKEKLGFKNFTRNEKIFFIGLQVWIFLQLSRVVAVPLINDVNAGAESPAWLYPAYLDLVAAFFGIPLMIALVKKRGLFTWTFAIMYLAISIVDHCGNFVTTATVGPPSIVGEGMNPVLAPAIQTVFDLLFVVLLMMPKYRQLFFKLSGESHN
ncbi:MAG: hypothetical protein AB8B56_20355 [Crocinitomicaceae bacterium]